MEFRRSEDRPRERMATRMPELKPPLSAVNDAPHATVRAGPKRRRTALATWMEGPTFIQISDTESGTIADSGGQRYLRLDRLRNALRESKRHSALENRSGFQHVTDSRNAREKFALRAAMEAVGLPLAKADGI